MRSLRLAVGLLTVLPVAPVQPTATTGRRAMLLAPVAVLPLAVVAAVVGGVGRLLGLPGYANGLLFVAALAFGTRAMHLDGLADTVDGLGSGGDRERALAVMRRGDVGPMGVVALLLVLGAQVIGAAPLLATPTTATVAALLVCASRGSLGLACVQGIPPARTDGLGRLVAGQVPVVPAVLSWVGWLLLAALLTLLGSGGVRLMVAVLVGGLVATAAVGLLLWRAVRRLGGTTGDVLGAAVELALAVLLLAGAAG